MDYEVRPGKGVGPLAFNMNVQQVRGLLGTPQRTIEQKMSGETTDIFSGGIAVYYDENGKLSLVDFLGPISPTLEGKKLLGIDPDEWLQDKDPDADVEPPDYISEKLGISFYHTDAGSQSVGVFRPGYYDFLTQEA